RQPGHHRRPRLSATGILDVRRWYLRGRHPWTRRPHHPHRGRQPRGSKAQFITTLTRVRADRALGLVRDDLAAQLPEHTVAAHPRIRRYIDNMSRSMNRAEATMDRLQPLAEHHAKAQAFQQRHQTTVAKAWNEAQNVQQSMTEKEAELDTVREQLHRQSLSQ